MHEALLEHPPRADALHREAEGASRVLAQLDRELLVYGDGQRWAVGTATSARPPQGMTLRALLPPIEPERLGHSNFRRAYRARHAYAAGAMAKGIASPAMVEALGRAGLLASYGAAGVPGDEVEAAVVRLRAALGEQPFAVNVIHSPHELRMEQHCVDICLRHGVRVVEASAYLKLTLPIVQYRCAGLSQLPEGRIRAANRIIAKISRAEVAARFLAPPPPAMVQALRAAGAISALQARCAAHVPMADDITVEADSGGHTDRRPLVCLLPAIRALRDDMARKHGHVQPVGVGAAGGIGTGVAAAAAFALGADYVVTGSVNQSCVESGSSEAVRTLLARADITDMDMAPAADMFEMGVQVQVLRRGTLFPARARQLYALYQRYPSLDAIPVDVRQRLESQLFRRPLEQVWNDTVAYFSRHDPGQIADALADPRHKMALLFRSYLGQSSHWARAGVADRAMDYQIWAGPAIGAFNQWVRGSYLEAPGARRVADVAAHIMRAAAFHTRLNLLRLHGVELPADWTRYRFDPGPGGVR
jgi:trans-AT polyketide synthase/acyltransferase/oxidoreductase domain-containing protein